MKTFKRSLLCLVAVIAFSLAACSNSSQADNKFFSDLFTTWQKRNEKAQKLHDEKNTTKVFLELSQIEYDNLKPYEEVKFKDEALGKEVKAYLSSLKQMIEALKTDPMTFDAMETYLKNYKDRVAHLKTISQDKRYTLPKEAIDDLSIDEERFIADKEAMKKRKNVIEQMEKDLNAVHFEVIEQASEANGGTYTIQGTYHNNSNSKLENIAYTIIFLNENEKELDKQTVTIDEVEAGGDYILTYTTTQVFNQLKPQVNIDHLKIDGK